MKYKIIAIKATGDPALEMELNSFLNSHKIIQIEKCLVQKAGSEYWTFCIEYLDTINDHKSFRKMRIDYKEVLSSAQFIIFDQLRKKRKLLAQNEGIPVFSVFTNEQLAMMVTENCKIQSDLEQTQGIAKARIEKYGLAMIEELNQDEKSRQSDSANS